MTPFSETIEDIPISIAASPGVIIEIGGRSAYINYEVKDLDVGLKQCYKALADAEDNFGKHEPTIEEKNIIDNPPPNIEPEPVIDPVSGEAIKENDVDDNGDLKFDSNGNPLL